VADEIKIEGIGKLMRQLKQLDPDLVAEVKETHRDAANRVAATARPKVPVRTGRLAADIRVGVTIKSGTVKIGRKAVPYAGPIHFGWPSRRIAPQPFMYEALDARRGELERLYGTRLAEIVAKVT
jgi:HK97 gp10 family phage protein